MKFTIDKNVYSTPENWDGVSVEMFKQIYALSENETDADLRKVGTVQIVAEIPEADMDKSSTNNLLHVYNNSLSFVENTSPSIDIQSLITVDGIQYYFDKDFTTGASRGLMKAATMYMENPIQNLDKILAMFIRPVIKPKYNYSKWKGIRKENYIDGYVTEPFNISQINERAKIMSTISVNKCYGIAAFFLIFTKMLLQNG